ncbi:MAG: hypothetical protein WC662_02415 [Candidatus Paceibacterota bacterium]|jgi:hypothetical protein
MNIITLPKNEYQKILGTQKAFERSLMRLEKLIFQIAQDEIKPEYSARLNKIEKQITSEKVKRFKNKNEVKKFFASL